MTLGVVLSMLYCGAAFGGSFLFMRIAAPDRLRGSGGDRRQRGAANRAGGLDGRGPGRAWAWTGVGLAALAASLYGIGLTFARLHLSGHEPIELAFGQLAAGAVLLIPFALVTAGDAHPTPASAGAILGIAIVSTAIAWPLLFRLNRQVGPLATSTIPFLNPIFGVVWGALFLGEAVTPTLLGGGVLVFIALALILDIRPSRWVRATPA